MENQSVLYEINEEKKIATITFNNPERKNAIGQDVFPRLTQILQQADVDPNVRVIVITGAGHNFSSGGNLSNNASGTGSADPLDITRDGAYPGITVIRAIQQCQKPVIAMVEGWCVGAAFSIALACDMIFASEDARFWHNFLSLGVCPELGSILTLTNAVGPHKAKEIWYTSKKISAAEGKEYGFVNEIYPAEELHDAVYALAENIAGLALASVYVTKSFVNNLVYGDMNMLLAAELQTQAFCLNSGESRQLMMSNFMKKKK